jgi:hypothetical protein
MLALLRRRDVVRASPFRSPASEPPLTRPFGKFKGELVDLLLAHPAYVLWPLTTKAAMLICVSVWRMSQAIEGVSVG